MHILLLLFLLLLLLLALLLSYLESNNFIGMSSHETWDHSKQ